MNPRPDLRAYARAAHMRWLKGDLAGAIEVMQSPLALQARRMLNRRMGEHAIGLLPLCRPISRGRATVRVPSGFRTLSAGATTAGQCWAEQVPRSRGCCRLRSRIRFRNISGRRRGAARAGHENEASGIETQLRQRGAIADPVH